MSAPEKTVAPRSDVIFYCALLLAVIGSICGIVIPNLRRPIENPNTNPCINILRSIDDAKKTWGLVNGKKPGDVPTWADILPYMVSRDGTQAVPKCPQGGVYTLGPLSNHPTCSFSGHVLP